MTEIKFLFDSDDAGDATTNQIACTTPADLADVKYLLSQPKGLDGRSEWVWVRLKDGTLMLATYPSGETYMHLSDKGVLDWVWKAEVEPDAVPNDLERLAAEFQALRAKGVSGPLADDVVINGVSYVVTLDTEADEEPVPAVTQVWSCGWNIPGHLPDDTPMNFEMWEQARDALADELLRAAEQFEDDGKHGEAVPYSGALKYLNAVDQNCNWAYRIGNYLWWIQLIVVPTNR